MCSLYKSHRAKGGPDSSTSGDGGDRYLPVQSFNKFPHFYAYFLKTYFTYVYTMYIFTICILNNIIKELFSVVLNRRIKDRISDFNIPTLKTKPKKKKKHFFSM